MVILVLGRDVYLTLFRVSSDTLGIPIRTSYFAKLKTFVQMTFVGLLLVALLARQGTLGVSLIPVGNWATNPRLVYWCMLIVTLLTVSSALQYTYDNWNILTALSRRYILGRSPQKLI